MDAWQQNVNRRLELLEGVLDVDPGSFERCAGTPSECGDACTDERCPLQNNRLHELGSIVVSLIEEFRWHRAWMAEMEHLGQIPAGTQARVTLRIRKSQLEDALVAAEATLKEVGTVQVLRTEVEHRIREIKTEIEAAARRLEETP